MFETDLSSCANARDLFFRKEILRSNLLNTHININCSLLLICILNKFDLQLIDYPNLECEGYPWKDETLLNNSCPFPHSLMMEKNELFYCNQTRKYISNERINDDSKKSILRSS